MNGAFAAQPLAATARRMAGGLKPIWNTAVIATTRSACIFMSTATALMIGAGAANADTYTPVTFTTNGNIQSDLISTFPTGSYTPSNNSFGVPFSIPSTGNNFNAISGSGSQLTITTSVSDVTNVFTLMNAYSPQSNDQIASIEFIATGGVSETFDLIAGTNIRDFYQGAFANSINGTTTQNAFSCSAPSECLGGGNSGNVDTGEYGTYNIDEQDFVLDSDFATQTLTEIIITNTSTEGGTPILLGITAADITSTPLPGALSLFLGGLGLFGMLAWPGKRRNSEAVAA